MTTILPDLDLSDLDLLNDEVEHWCCMICFPATGVLIPYIALCGKPALSRRELPTPIPGPNDCPDCTAVLNLPCRKCGAM